MGNRKIIQSLVFLGSMAALVICASEEEPGKVTENKASATINPKWGHYDGDPVTKWNPDGRTMTLLTELRYTDPQGNIWVAPIGSVVDGASIPRYLWSIMGGPFEGQYRNASVLHDVSYDEHNRPWQDCDRMFYYAMRCSGVNVAEAKTMFYALYKFGHHWKFPIKRAKAVKYEGQMVARGEEIPRAIPVNPEEINEAHDWISNTDPTLEQIEQRATGQEHADATPEESEQQPNAQEQTDAIPQQSEQRPNAQEHTNAIPQQSEQRPNAQEHTNAIPQQSEQRPNAQEHADETPEQSEQPTNAREHINASPEQTPEEQPKPDE